MNEVTINPVHEDLEAYALGALDRDDAVRFEQHLDGCDECRRELASYVPVTNALRSIPAVVPPPLPALEPTKTVTPLRRRVLPAAFGYAAAAAVLLAAGAGVATLLQPPTDQQLMSVAGMLADGPRQAVLQGEGVRGRVIVGRRNRRAAIIVRGLPAPPQGSAYHVWIVDSKPVLVGALTPARDGIEVLLMDASRVSNGHALQVSLEPVDAGAPGGAPVASGRL
jgi:anti-sigma factor RsiW